MPVHPLAGQPAPPEMLVDVPRLVSAFYTLAPEPADAAQRVSFGTSGHRGSSLDAKFNEDHILAISQAICESRSAAGIDGPLFLGVDTHALSEPAFVAALEVFAANSVRVRMDEQRRPIATPVISHAILSHNRGRERGLADGVVITPSHNPPEDGGFKYNPPTGGPAGTATTAAIQMRANELLEGGVKSVRRMPVRRALAAETTERHDLIQPYVEDLGMVLDMEAIGDAGVRIGADPMGGAALPLWEPIAERWGLNIEVVNRTIDPTFRFVTVDGDGKIRMDCSSPYAMAGLIGLRDRFDIAFGNDPDADRHGIVTRQAGLMNPNHFLAVAVEYLFGHREGWPSDAGVGKTLVSSSMIDRVAKAAGRRLVEVPVGFKWFVEPLREGAVAFAGEESAGASFLRRDGSVWTTDKDGILLALLAAEILAVTGRDPAEHYASLTERFGTPVYERTGAPATAGQKAALKQLSPEMVRTDTLAGDPITATYTRAPGNDAPIGGLKIETERGWFAARPSGTEDIYKIYAESFRGEEHLRLIQEEAQAIVNAVL